MLEWSRWPYDPESVGRDVIDQAVQALRDDAQNGIHQIERAVAALDVAVGMVNSRITDYHGSTLAKIDIASGNIHIELSKAMTAIYDAAKIAEGI